MKAFRIPLLLLSAGLMLGSCAAFQPKYGCGTNGKNVGAEQIAGGKEVKARKFRS